MVLLVESHQVIIGFEGKIAAAAAQGDVVLFGERDGSAVRLVQGECVMLAERVLLKLHR